MDRGPLCGPFSLRIALDYVVTGRASRALSNASTNSASIRILWVISSLFARDAGARRIVSDITNGKAIQIHIRAGANTAVSPSQTHLTWKI